MLRSMRTHRSKFYVFLKQILHDGLSRFVSLVVIWKKFTKLSLKGEPVFGKNLVGFSSIELQITYKTLCRKINIWLVWIFHQTRTILPSNLEWTIQKYFSTFSNFLIGFHQNANLNIFMNVKIWDEGVAHPFISIE